MELQPQRRFHTAHDNPPSPVGAMVRRVFPNPPAAYKESHESLRYDVPEIRLKATRWFRKQL